MLRIYDDSDRILRTKCDEVPLPYGKEDIDRLKEMAEYLRLSQDDAYARKNRIQAGIGLAAPQIGLSKRMFAIYLDDGGTLFRYGLINPRILRTSVKKAYLSGGEGCLSVKTKHPGIVQRYYKTVMEGYDVFEEKTVRIVAYGYLSIALQHEYDHLDGILYYDHIDKKHPFRPDLGSVEI